MTSCCILFSVLVLFSTGNCSGGKENVGVYSEKCYNYLLYLPEEYENNQQQQWPLIVSLHAISLRGDDLEKVKESELPGLVAKGRSFPFIIVSPQCPGDKTWATDEWFPPFLDELKSKYRIDQSRIYLTGAGFGGEGVWYLAIRYPDTFAAIAPASSHSGIFNIPVKAPGIRHIPTWVFHGAQDLTVPLKESEIIVDSLKKCGGDVKFDVIPSADHLSYRNEVYNKDSLYEWFLKHKQGYVYPNGQKRCEGPFLDGKKNGKWTYWYDDGSKEMEGEYKDGNLNGEWIYWDKKGEQTGKGEFLKGTGRWFKWYKGGSKERLEAFADGIRDGRWLYWHENGRIRYQSQYKLGKQHGRWSGWSEYGTVLFDIGFLEGKPHGKWTFWNENGEELRSETWNNGVLKIGKK